MNLQQEPVKDTQIKELINDIKSETEQLEMKTEEKKTEFWNIITEKVYKYLKAGIITTDDDVRPIFYKGHSATIWSFVDNNITYEFREEKVSSYEGYTRYQVKIDGVGIHCSYDADDKFGHYDTISNDAIVSIMKNLHEHLYKTNSKDYAQRKLEEIEKQIEIIK